MCFKIKLLCTLSIELFSRLRFEQSIKNIKYTKCLEDHSLLQIKYSVLQFKYQIKENRKGVAKNIRKILALILVLLLAVSCVLFSDDEEKEKKTAGSYLYPLVSADKVYC